MPDVFITGIDVLIGLVILVSAIYAAYRGLMRETLSIFAWAVAAYLSLQLFPLSQSIIGARIQPEWLAGGVALIGVFLVILVPLSFATYRFSEKVEKTAVGPVDRALGFLFGIGRGLVIVALAYIVFSALVPISQHPAWIRRAHLLPLIQGTSEVLLTLVPEDNTLRKRNVMVEATPERVARRRAPVPTAAPTPRPRPSDAQKSSPTKRVTYGADDRRALDRLIEATGSK